MKKYEGLAQSTNHLFYLCALVPLCEVLLLKNPTLSGILGIRR
jgi:hypothetical protein